MPSEAQVLDALRAVRDPDLHRDIVSLGFVKDVTISRGSVSFKIELTTPACPVRDQMKQQAEHAVRALPGVGSVDVTMTSRVASSRGPAARDLIPGVKNVISVSSGKGGVGKSTVAVNLAIALAQTGAKVGLLDADVTGPNVPLMMGAAGAVPVAEKNGVKMLMPLESYGVKLMSIGFLVPDDTPMIWRGPMVGGAIKQLLTDVDWGELDYLVLDMPPGTGDAPLTVAQTVPQSGAVIVTTPQDVALQDVVKAIRMCQKLEVPILGMVENMAFFTCPHCGGRTEIFSYGGGERAAEQLKLPFLGRIPLATEIREGGDTGAPIAAAMPDSPQAKAFRDVAGAIAARVSMLPYLNVPLIRDIPIIKKS